MNWEDLSALNREELEKMNMITILRKMDEETRLMRERFEHERECHEQEREEERKRFEQEMLLRRERHEHEMEKMRHESRKIRMEWLLAPIVAAVAASGATITALKWMQ